MSRKDRKFKRFFRSKSSDLQKKKKKRSSPKFRAIFLPKFRNFKRFRGGSFRMGGGYFQFFTENRPQKHKKHAILHTSQVNGGARAPPRPPWLRYCLYCLEKVTLQSRYSNLVIQRVKNGDIKNRVIASFNQRSF